MRLEEPERTTETWIDGRGWVKVRPEVALRLLHLRGAQRTRIWREERRDVCAR